MADVKTLTVDGVTYDIKDEKARADIANKQDKLPDGTTGYFLKKTDAGVEWAEGAAPGDDVTIKVNTTTNKLYAVAVKDNRDTTSNIKTWTGTKAQYDAIGTKDDNTIYYVADDTAKSEFVTNLDLLAMLNSLYPVGSIYIGTQATCPLATLIKDSSWELVESGRALWTGNGSNGNAKIAAGLPNITGTITFVGQVSRNTDAYNSLVSDTIDVRDGWPGVSSSSSRFTAYRKTLSAQKVNDIYGNSNTVQPPAYVVNVWRRTK